MAQKFANLSVTRSFEKRFTDKSGWGGTVAPDVTLKIDDHVWSIEHAGKAYELDKGTREGLMDFALQCLQDSYAGAEDLADAQKRFNSKLENIVDGSWGSDTRGSGVNQWLYEARNVVRGIYQADDEKAYKKFNKLDTKEQNKALDIDVVKYADAFGKDEFEALVAERIKNADERRAKEVAFKAKLAAANEKLAAKVEVKL